MFTVTFYSYKGGVGRTLALINVAIRLAGRGKKVFILDFDLEAPGIDAFGLFPRQEGRQGLLEYISQYRQSGNPASLREFVTEVSTPKIGPGKIAVLPAGSKDKNYQVQLSRLDWKYFYKEQHGFLFVENLKSAIDKEFSPDYVLVDSRTGLTDVSGICTLQLPDLVVFLFNLNNQNVMGINQIHKSVRFNRLDREVETLLVASPIPDVSDFGGIRGRRLDEAKKLIGSPPDIILPHDPFVAFEETLLWESEFDTNLSRAYRLLTEAIIDKNSKDVLTLLKEARRLRDQGNIDIADLRYQELVESKPSDAEAWSEYGVFLKMRGKFDQAAENFQKAYAMNPQDTKVLAQLCMTHLHLKHEKEAAHYLNEFLALSNTPKEIGDLADTFTNAGALGGAMLAYQRANELSENADLHLEIGNIYMRMSKPEAALPHYLRGYEMSPTNLACVYNCGYALSKLGDERAAGYFKKAIEVFEQKAPNRAKTAEDANTLQAMSHAYVGLGEFKTACKQLETALAIARGLPPVRKVFSSQLYKPIPVKLFMEETSHLLHLARERLCDPPTVRGRQ